MATPDPRQVEYEKARREWEAANPGKSFRGTEDAEGITAEERWQMADPQRREELKKQLDFADKSDSELGQAGAGLLGAIPLVGGIAATGLTMANAAARERREKVRQGMGPEVDAELQAFIDELSKPTDWNSPETRLLLGEARGAARREASNRGLGGSGGGLENTQQAAENAKARYNLQRQQLLSNALSAKSGRGLSLEQLQMQKGEIAARSSANADRNAIALGGGLAQAGTALYNNYFQNQNQPTSGLSPVQKAPNYAASSAAADTAFDAPEPEYGLQAPVTVPAQQSSNPPPGSSYWENA